MRTVAVIGAGLSGMISSLILARYGYKVLLFESARRAGLAVRGFTRENVYFDTGLHYVGGMEEGGILQQYLRFLGLADMPVQPFDADCFDAVSMGSDAPFRMPVGFSALKEALCAQFPADVSAVTAYLDKSRAIFQSSPLIRLDLDRAAVAAMHNEGSHGSLAAFLDTLTKNTRLKSLLSIHTLLHGTPAHEVPFTHHAYVAASYFDSVHSFAGGGRAVVTALEARLAAAGVTLMCNTPVRSLHCDAANRLTDIVLDDAAIAVDAALCTTHPAALAAMAASGGFRPAYVQRLQDLEETASAYMLFGIAQTVPKCLQGKNLFLLHDAGGDPLPTAEGGAPSFYVTCSPQITTGRQAAAGHGIVVISPARFSDVEQWAATSPDIRPESYKQFKAKRLKALRSALVDRCPELATVRFVDGATPLTLREYLHAPQGGLYGCKHTMHQFNPQPATRIPNLFLAGQSVIGPGLLGACISAFIACGFLIGHKTLQQDVLCS